MQITGKNLELLVEALELAEAEVHNMIATCPNVIEYADEIEEYYNKKQRIITLKRKAKAAISKAKEKRIGL